MTWEMRLSYKYGGEPTLTFSPGIPTAVKMSLLPVAILKLAQDEDIPVGNLLALINKTFANTFEKILDGKGEDDAGLH